MLEKNRDRIKSVLIPFWFGVRKNIALHSSASERSPQGSPPCSASVIGWRTRVWIWVCGEDFFSKECCIFRTFCQFSVCQFLHGSFSAVSKPILRVSIRSAALNFSIVLSSKFSHFFCLAPNWTEKIMYVGEMQVSFTRSPLCSNCC